MSINNSIANKKSWENSSYRLKTSKAISRAKKNVLLSVEHKQKISKGLTNSTIKKRGKSHSQWKGEDVLYSSKHNYIRRTYGKADQCVNVWCVGISKKFEWSFIHGRQDTRDVKNYRKLCISCHRLYDNRKNNMKKQTILTQTMKILITGSSGMIGSALSLKLKEQGHEVVGIDQNYPNFTDLQPTILHDLRSELHNSVLSEMQFDLMIHLAANARVYNSVKDPTLSFDNIATTFWALEFARKNKIPKFLFASSRETYGNGNELPVAEDKASQRKAESPYTAGKVAGEAYCYAYSECYGIDTMIMRYSNVYGRFDNSDRFVPKAIKKMRANEPFEIWGDGKSMSFTYLDDCVDGTILLINRWNEGVAMHKEYNIAASTQDSLLSVATKIKEELGSTSEITVTENLVGEVMNFQADINKMNELGWSPVTSIEEGIKKSIQYYVAQP